MVRLLDFVLFRRLRKTPAHSILVMLGLGWSSSLSQAMSSLRDSPIVFGGGDGKDGNAQFWLVFNLETLKTTVKKRGYGNI